MDQEKAISLLHRQLTDIQSNADRILSGDNSSENVEAFARYSSELKRFVAERIQHDEILEATDSIPSINYQRGQVKLWQYILLPLWWISIYKDYQARKQTVEEIATVRGKYASLQLLIQGIM